MNDKHISEAVAAVYTVDHIIFESEALCQTSS